MDINNIKTDGFSLEDTEKRIKNVAFLSLKSSIQAYCTTYKCERGKLSNIKNQEGSIGDKYTISYIENSCNAITKFHHFVELILKEILNEKHPLLAIDASKKHDIFYNLVHNIAIDAADYEKLHFLEFSETLERICSLIKSNKIDSTKYAFINEASTWLKELNVLRNRISHRGTFILRYEALDYLFGKYALPFLMNVNALPEYTTYENLWKYQVLDSKIDPIIEIIDECKKRTYNIDKISILKELGRAAYLNPLFNVKYLSSLFDEPIIKSSVQFTKVIRQNENIGDIKKCPVCGVETLALYIDTDVDENEEGKVLNTRTFNYLAKCFCCSFEIEHEIGKLDRMGLAIENYWMD